MTNNIEQMARERLSEQADAMGQWEIGHAIRMGHDSMIVSIALQVIAAALREQRSAHGVDEAAAYFDPRCADASRAFSFCPFEHGELKKTSPLYSRPQPASTRFVAHKDENGHYDSIDDADGNVVVHLHRGTVRNESEGGVVRLLTALNSHPASATSDADKRDAERLDYIERKFSGMTNRERYLPVEMIWGKGCNGRTLREACDKYMDRDAAIAAQREAK